MTNKVTKEEFLEDLKRVADEIGKSPSVEDYKEHGNHSFDLGRRKFGSWNEAKESAGLETFSRGPFADRTGWKRYKCYSCGSEFRANPDLYKKKCDECGKQCNLRRAKLEFMKTSEVAMDLSEGPVVGNIDIDEEIRPLIEKLKLPEGKHRNIPMPASRRQVYYLVGDEREAMRVFIDEYEDYIGEVLNQNGSTNAFVQNWNEYMYELLLQQWHLR